MYLREISFFKLNDRNFAYVPETFQLFEASYNLKKTVENYPSLSHLEREIGQQEIEKNVHQLVKNRLLTIEKPEEPALKSEADSWEQCILCCDSRNGRVADRSVVERIVRFASDKGCRNFVFSSSEPDKAIICADSLKGDYQLSVMSSELPESRDAVKILDGKSIRFIYQPEKITEEHIEKIVQYRSRCRADSFVISLDLNSYFQKNAELLKDAGIENFWMDYWCSGCRASDNTQVLTEPEIGIGFARRTLNRYPVQRKLLGCRKKQYGCSAGIGSFAVTADGNIWVCSSVIGESRYLMGNISTDINRSLRSGAVATNRDSTCRYCWGRYLCGGGSNIIETADKKSSCDKYLKYLEAVLGDFAGLDYHKRSEMIAIGNSLQVIMEERIGKGVMPTVYKGRRKLKVFGTSMEPLIKGGDSVEVWPVKPEDVKVGDVVCFDHPPACHRIIRIKGNRFYEQGDNQPVGRWINKRLVNGIVMKIVKDNGDELNLYDPLNRIMNRIRGLGSRLKGLGFRYLRRRGLNEQRFKVKRESQI